MTLVQQPPVNNGHYICVVVHRLDCAVNMNIFNINNDFYFIV
jgi:hypothetical protein